MKRNIWILLLVYRLEIIYGQGFASNTHNTQCERAIRDNAKRLRFLCPCSIKANTDEILCVNYEHLHMSATENSKPCTCKRHRSRLRLMHACRFFVCVFRECRSRILCVQTFAAHFTNNYAHLLCFALFHFISFRFYVHAQYSLTCSNSVDVLFEDVFLIVGYKWTSNAGTYRDFIFECWPKHVNQHLLHSDSATQNGEERKACVWQRWKCVAEKRSIECCYTIQHFTSVWSLVDYRYVCMYFCHFACSAASKFMHVQFVENKRRTEMQAPFGTAHPRWVIFNLQNLNEHSIYILGAHFVYWNRRKRMGKKIEIFYVGCFDLFLSGYEKKTA